MADSYGKIGNNRLVKFAAKRESVAGSYLTSQSVKDCRLSAGESLKVRVKTPVGVTGGSNTGSVSKGQSFQNTKNGRKKQQRELAARRRENAKQYR